MITIVIAVIAALIPSPLMAAMSCDTPDPKWQQFLQRCCPVCPTCTPDDGALDVITTCGDAAAHAVANAFASADATAEAICEAAAIACEQTLTVIEAPCSNPTPIVQVLDGGGLDLLSGRLTHRPKYGANVYRIRGLVAVRPAAQCALP